MRRSTDGRLQVIPVSDSDTHIPHEHVALFSGGYDSLVMTHKVMTEGVATAVLHLDTGTGLDENLQFVRDVCEEYDWPLYVREAKKPLEEFAKEWGFPKAGSHSWAYRYFKEHTLQRFTSEIETDEMVHYYTGVRRAESERRKINVTDEYQEHAAGRWMWVSPIMHWSDEDCYQYRMEHDLPENPVAENICRSGECYCGAFAHRDEEMLQLEAHYPEHAEWLKQLEEEVQSEIGKKQDYCWWGSEGLSKSELRALIAENDEDQMFLCQDCEWGGQLAD